MKCRVELVYDLDCPNIDAARTTLLQAFARAGVAASWKEWDRKAPESPAYVRRYGSPTILVNGQDVVSAEPTDGGDCCRLYSDGETGFRGVPPIDQIVTVLMKDAHAAASAANETGRGWRWGSLLLLYLGLIVLMGVSLWNFWPHGAAASGSCVRCASREPESEQ